MQRNDLIALYLRAYYENALADGELMSDIPYKNLNGYLRAHWKAEAIKATNWPYLVPWKGERDGKPYWMFEERREV